MSAPFQVRGVIEGFYGPPYTHPERLDLVRFLGAHGFDLYVYAPKNDRKHRARWREPYSAKAMRRFSETLRTAREAGVEFCYALAPGVDMSYADEEDTAAVLRKLEAFWALGVRSFSLLLDDIASTFRHEADRTRYASYAAAHADLCNLVHGWLEGQGGHFTLSMCPTAYHGTAPFKPYLHELGEKLHPDIGVFYTGPDVCSPSICAHDAEAFAEAVKRRPLIWDNYPVNDLAMQGELHIGPIRNRDAALHEAAEGIVVNPMLQAEASKIPLATFSDYLLDPAGYDPDASWERALIEVAGEESAPALRLLGENSLHSCLGTPEASRLAELVEAAVAALAGGEDPAASPSVTALRAYLSALDEACDHLKVEMDNLPLRNELLPWIDALERWLWTGRFALDVLEAQREGRPADAPRRSLEEFFAAAAHHHKRIAGRALEPLATLALRGVTPRAPS